MYEKAGGFLGLALQQMGQLLGMLDVLYVGSSKGAA
jgi:hypothetical protein